MRTSFAIAVFAYICLFAIPAPGITSNGRSGAQAEAARLEASARRPRAFQERLAEQERARRDGERMRALPPETALDVAAGRVAFDDLAFDENGLVHRSDGARPPQAPSAARGETRLRIAGLSVSVALILAGLFAKRGASAAGR